MLQLFAILFIAAIIYAAWPILLAAIISIMVNGYIDVWYLLAGVVVCAAWLYRITGIGRLSKDTRSFN